MLKPASIGCIVTAPINKEALNLAGHHYDGHTGMLRSLTGSKSAYMLLASERLKVIHVSTHVSLQERSAAATTERVLATIRAGDAHLRRIGYAAPQIAVAGINPHCGENGLFGTEDDDQIAPAVEAARPRASTFMVRSPPTRCSTAPIPAPSIWSSRSITTRGTSRSSSSPSIPR